MNIKLNVFGYGYEIARNKVEASGSPEDVTGRLSDAVSEIEYDPFGAEKQLYGFTDAVITIADASSAVLYETEVGMDDAADRSALQEGQYYVEYESQEKGTWIESELEIDDGEFEEAKKAAAAKYGLQDENEIIRKVFGEIVSVESDEIDGMMKVATAVNIGDWAWAEVGTGLSTEGKSVSVTVYDFNGEIVCLDDCEDDEE